MNARRYPHLPKEVQTPGGVVVVKRVPPIKLPTSVEAWGTWEPYARTIEIDQSPPMRHQWKVLFHELTHVALDDSGLCNGMTEEMQEAVCDAVATARLRERFG